MLKMFTAGAAALGALLLSIPAQAGDVSVTINGVRAGNGPLYLSLQTRDQFMKNEGSYGQIVQSPAPGALKVSLSGVAAGEYAVSVWHDIDGDSVFDRDDDGKPLDGWAMIDGASLRAEPTFDEVSFKVEKSSVSIELDMIYADE